MVAVLAVNEQESYRLEHLIDALVCDHWRLRSAATEGYQPGYWKVWADHSYVVEVGAHRLKVYQAHLVRDYAGQVTRFRAWLDTLPHPRTSGGLGLGTRAPETAVRPFQGRFLHAGGGGGSAGPWTFVPDSGTLEPAAT